MKITLTKVTCLRTLICILVITFAFACKKDKPEPEHVEQTPAPPALVKTMIAKVNGNNWSACNECFSSQKSGLGYYYFVGFDTPYSPFSLMLLGFKNYADTFVIAQGPAFAQYKNVSGTYFTAKSGTIIISQLDTTSAGAIKRLKGSFNFMTDTINGNFFNITEGIIDYEN